MDKSFFKERSIAAIQSLDSIVTLDSPMLLPERFVGCDLSRQAFVIDFPLVPEEFQVHSDSFKDAQKWLKHGNYQKLTLPTTQQEARRTQKSLLGARARASDKLAQYKNAINPVLGLSHKPLVGGDLLTRIYSFYEIMEAAKLFSYIENFLPLEYDKKSDNLRIYLGSNRVAREGASGTIRLPSRQQKKPRYAVDFHHLPVVDNEWKTAIAQSFTTTYSGNRPENACYRNIRYTFFNETQRSHVRSFVAHDILSYFVLQKFFAHHKNMVPWNVGPFPKPSQLAAKLHAVCDHGLLLKDYESGHLRKPYVVEKANIIAQGVASFGHDAMLYWDGKGNGDPKYKDFSWNV